MATFNNMKIKVASSAELRAVVAKLVSLGYGIGSNRTKRASGEDYDSVFAYSDGMILFGTNTHQWGMKGTSYDRNNNPAVAIDDFLA